MLYTPLSFWWVAYMLRSQSVWFFTPSNPNITFGGMEGETKQEMYDLLPTALYPTTTLISNSSSAEEMLLALQQSGIQYPFIVKPDVGWQGILLRKIENEKALLAYHEQMKWPYLIQELITYPIEVSVFYIRYPGSEQGKITGFLQKIPMQVIGDGKSTLAQLVAQHPKGSAFQEKLKKKYVDSWQTVVAKNESVVLAAAANHNRGARFIDLKEHITPELTNLFDNLSTSGTEFYYGRYDIMCRSIADLQQGQHFSILEYNGCGAEPNHFYDTGYSLIGAYKEILFHWKALYEISLLNRQNGIQPWPFKKGRDFLLQTKQLLVDMKEVDQSMHYPA